VQKKSIYFISLSAFESAKKVKDGEGLPISGLAL
jgi:hypothetical protein